MGTAWQVGQQIQGRWEVFEIFTGGAGVVYIVYDHVFHNRFAAKIFRYEVVACDHRLADRFIQESQTSIRLDAHPNITRARMVEKIEEKAMACYDIALRLDPELASAWFNKGVAQLASRHVDEALACYEQALRLNPKSGQVWSNRGVALKSQGHLR